MTLRRRLALFLDPTLTPETHEVILGGWMHNAPLQDLARHAEHIARTLDKIEARKRRPRNVWCEHPELHPDVDKFEVNGIDPKAFDKAFGR